MTARTRSPSPASGTSKKAKIEKQAQKDIALPVGEALDQWRGTYDSSTPYRHAVVPGLLTDELLEGVVEESRTYGVRGKEGSLPGWGWEQKETDIYKIQQTPDLASLDPEHLPEETLAALPYLNRLRSALYSSDFRSFVRKVTGCGPLSGKKTDGSVGLYSQGSHLLLHDDSISTRVVSWILYLPNSPTSAPSSSHLRPSTSGKFLKGWDPAWGGGLELFPVESGEETGLPGVKSVHKVPVQWGQIVFFEVQPGRSYHSVEEVIVGDGRQRLGVSGWFHAPVEGEEGYAPVDTEKVKADLSSLAQITSAPTLPLTAYTSDPPTGLSSSHLSFLSQYLAPSYLSAGTLEKLCGQFEAASEIVLHNFLNPTIAFQMKDETKGIDIRDYPVKPAIVPQDLGEANGWTIQGPSSKHRYLSLARTGECSTPTLQRILSELLPSPAFRAWLGVVSSLTPMAHRTEARRFRKGLDYTLANGEAASGEARLDVWLGASWWADVPVASDAEEALLDDGGWECYLASPEEGEDPAVFQSKHAKRVADGEGEGDANATNGNATGENGDGAEGSENGQEFELEINQEESDELSPSDFDSDSEDGEEDDGPLLTQAVSFNKLLLVLRDPGVMKFVKYLGAGAGGSRWDVGGEWEVGMLEEESDGEGEGESKE